MVVFRLAILHVEDGRIQSVSLTVRRTWTVRVLRGSFLLGRASFPAGAVGGGVLVVRCTAANGGRGGRSWLPTTSFARTSRPIGRGCGVRERRMAASKASMSSRPASCISRCIRRIATRNCFRTARLPSNICFCASRKAGDRSHCSHQSLHICIMSAAGLSVSTRATSWNRPRASTTASPGRPSPSRTASRRSSDHSRCVIIAISQRAFAAACRAIS